MWNTSPLVNLRTSSFHKRSLSIWTPFITPRFSCARRDKYGITSFTGPYGTYLYTGKPAWAKDIQSFSVISFKSYIFINTITLLLEFSQWWSNRIWTNTYIYITHLTDNLIQSDLRCITSTFCLFEVSSLGIKSMTWAK